MRRRRERTRRTWRVRWERVGGVLAAGGALFAALVVHPNLRDARRTHDEVAAIGALRQIATAQALFREADLDQDGVFRYGSLDELLAAGLLPEDLFQDPCFGFGVHAGYSFRVQPSSTTPEFLWMATASPLESDAGGRRHFAINQYGETAFRLGQPFPLRDDCELPRDAMRGCGCGKHR